MKKQPIILEATKDKQVDYHYLYSEKDAERREKRLISEGFSVRRLKIS